MSALIKRMTVVLAVLSFFPGIMNAGELPQYAKVPKITAVAAAYKAKILCSAVFVSKRNPSDVQQEELKYFPFPAKIDEKKKTVTVTVGMGMPDQTAIFREGLGCTLGVDYTAEHILAQVTGNPTPPPPDKSQLKKLWPEGEFVNTENIPPEVDKSKLSAAIDRTFTEPHAA
jgi:hypothetical protein